MIYFFPLLSTAISIGAAVVYFAKRDVWHGVYWLLGAAITIVASFCLKSK